MIKFNKENRGGGKNLKTGWPIVGESEGSFRVALAIFVGD